MIDLKLWIFSDQVIELLPPKMNMKGVNLEFTNSKIIFDEHLKPCKNHLTDF